MPTEIQIKLSKFGRTKMCKAHAYGNVLFQYRDDQILWVERSEDEYAIMPLKKKGQPFCVVYSSDWKRANEVEL